MAAAAAPTSAPAPTARVEAAPALSGATRGTPAAAPRLPRHPFAVTDAGDHCETPAAAYAHAAPLLDALAEDGAVFAGTLYDPFYCAGSAAVRLARLGFDDVVNRNEDFYAACARPPKHDVVLTNPPFSGDHPQRLLEWAVRRHSPGAVQAALAAGSSGSGGGGGGGGGSEAYADGGPAHPHPARERAAALPRSRNAFAALCDSDDDSVDDGVDDGAAGGARDAVGSAGGDGRPPPTAPLAPTPAPPTPADGFAPWLALLPAFTANKPWFHRLRVQLEREAGARGWGPPLLFIGPTRHAYEFTVPEGARPRGGREVEGVVGATTVASTDDASQQPPREAASAAGVVAQQPLPAGGAGGGSVSDTPAAATAGAAIVRPGSFQCVWFVGGLGARCVGVLERLRAAHLLQLREPRETGGGGGGCGGGGCGRGGGGGGGRRQRAAKSESSSSSSPPPGAVVVVSPPRKRARVPPNHVASAAAAATDAGPLAAAVAATALNQRWALLPRTPRGVAAGEGGEEAGGAALALGARDLPALVLARPLTPAERRWRRRRQQAATAAAAAGQ